MPCNFHTQGEWMVCPDLDSQVCILDRQGRVVAQPGDGKAENGDVGSRRSQFRARFTPAKFITQHDAIFLHAGDILVAEWLSPRATHASAQDLTGTALLDKTLFV